MTFVPKRMFFTKGVGRHREYLSSFELALRDAKIETCNLVTVSSIVPAGCKRIPVDDGAQEIVPGQITYAVMARNSTNSMIFSLQGVPSWPLSRQQACRNEMNTRFSSSGEKEKIQIQIMCKCKKLNSC